MTHFTFAGFEQVKATMNSQPLSNGYPYRKLEHEAGAGAGGMNKAQPHILKSTAFVYYDF